MDGAFGDFDAFLEGEGGQLAAFLSRTRGRGIVGWLWWLLVAMAVQTKFSRFFFDGVLLSQKTHGFSLASVRAWCKCGVQSVVN